MSQYFSKPYERSSRHVKAGLHLCNYATVADLKVATGVYTSDIAAKSDLARLKAELGEIEQN